VSANPLGDAATFERYHMQRDGLVHRIGDVHVDGLQITRRFTPTGRVCGNVQSMPPEEQIIQWWFGSNIDDTHDRDVSRI